MRFATPLLMALCAAAAAPTASGARNATTRVSPVVSNKVPSSTHIATCAEQNDPGLRSLVGFTSHPPCTVGHGAPGQPPACVLRWVLCLARPVAGAPTPHSAVARFASSFTYWWSIPFQQAARYIMHAKTACRLPGRATHCLCTPPAPANFQPGRFTTRGRRPTVISSKRCRRYGP